MAASRDVAVVTGATSGLGQWVAVGLARAGMHVVLLARNPAKAAVTQRLVERTVPGASVATVTADLSSLRQTREAGEGIAATHGRVRVLVNNAGLITPRRQVTEEGREMIFAVNHLAPFVLTNALEGALKAAAPARIVNVGSTASDRATLDLSDLEGVRSWNPVRAYGRSKLALMMATFERARLLAGTGVSVNVVHPGVVATSIGDVPGPVGWVWALGKPFMISPERGAHTPLFVALSPEAEGVTGAYWKRSAQVRPNPQALDAKLVHRLWEETQRLAG